MSNRYQTAFSGRHTKFRVLSLPQSQYFANEVISERYKSKSYTISSENKFFAPNISEMNSIGKALPL